MKPYQLHLLNHVAPLSVELDCHRIENLSELASQSRFLVGYLSEPDENGCQPKVMIATSRILCVIEVN